MMKVSCKEIIAENLWDDLVIIGDKGRSVNTVVPLSAPKPHALTFVKPGRRVDSALFKEMIIICDQATADTIDTSHTTALIVSNPKLFFIRVTSKFFTPSPLKPGIHPSAVIEPTAQIDESAYIGAGCYVSSQAVIGADVVLRPNVTLLNKVTLGDGTCINSGTVIGADGFGYERNEQGEMEKFPHLGGVRIGKNVEIGSNTSIDRGTLNDTVIEDRVKVDNLCHISHNVIIGKDSVIIANCMLAGSVKIGEQCWISPSSNVLNQLHVGKNVTVGIGALVMKSVKDNETVIGAPALPLKQVVAQRRAIKALLEK